MKINWNALGNRVIDGYNSWMTMLTHSVATIVFVAWWTGHLKVVQMTDQLWMISIH